MTVCIYLLTILFCFLHISYDLLHKLLSCMTKESFTLSILYAFKKIFFLALLHCLGTTVKCSIEVMNVAEVKRKMFTIFPLRMVLPAVYQRCLFYSFNIVNYIE